MAQYMAPLPRRDTRQPAFFPSTNNSRARMLGMLASNRVPLLAYHFAWPGIGHVSKRGDGFAYHPQPAQMQSVSAL